MGRPGFSPGTPDFLLTDEVPTVIGQVSQIARNFDAAPPDETARKGPQLCRERLVDERLEFGEPGRGRIEDGREMLAHRVGRRR